MLPEDLRRTELAFLLMTLVLFSMWPFTLTMAVREWSWHLLKSSGVLFVCGLMSMELTLWYGTRAHKASKEA